VDFFIGIPASLQKLWCNLLLGTRDLAGIRSSPEMEGHLKLLYMAVTGCIQHFFIAKMSALVAGNAVGCAVRG